jgi:acyl-CoA thioester hydrolase
MASFQKSITVQKSDLDELKHVNNVRYVEWIQEISKEHWESKADKSIQEQLIWVVRNHNITYYESAILNDVIAIKTQVTDWKGPISVRQVEMKNNKTGNLLVMATTEWCALHSQTLKPIRVAAEIQQLFEVT